MTDSYDTSLATAKDRVRFYIGDTTSSAFILSDAEISAVLVLYTDEIDAACECMESILSRYAHIPSKSNLSLSVGSERYKQVETSLAKLRSLKARRATSKGCVIVAGGTTIDERDGYREDSTLIQPSFTIDQNDHPGAVPPDEE